MALQRVSGNTRHVATEAGREVPRPAKFEGQVNATAHMYLPSSGTSTPLASARAGIAQGRRASRISGSRRHRAGWPGPARSRAMLVFRIEGFYFIHKLTYHDQEFTLCGEMCQVSQLHFLRSHAHRNNRRCLFDDAGLQNPASKVAFIQSAQRAVASNGSPSRTHSLRMAQRPLKSEAWLRISSACKSSLSKVKATMSTVMAGCPEPLCCPIETSPRYLQSLGCGLRHVGAGIRAGLPQGSHRLVALLAAGL